MFTNQIKKESKVFLWNVRKKKKKDFCPSQSAVMRAVTRAVTRVVTRTLVCKNLEEKIKNVSFRIKSKCLVKFKSVCRILIVLID